MTTTDQILQLERGALDRWGQGDPGGFLDVYGPGITYFDPVTAARIDGHDAMEDYYRPVHRQDPYFPLRDAEPAGHRRRQHGAADPTTW